MRGRLDRRLGGAASLTKRGAGGTSPTFRVQEGPASPQKVIEDPKSGSSLGRTSMPLTREVHTATVENVRARLPSRSSGGSVAGAPRFNPLGLTMLPADPRRDALALPIQRRIQAREPSDWSASLISHVFKWSDAR